MTSGGGGMGALFSKKKKYWVPEHRKMDDKLEDLSKWKAVEDMTGWQMQNSAGKIGDAMGKTKGTAEVNLSYNGLGDDECEGLAIAIKQTRTIKRIILSNNHIHENGAQVGHHPCFSRPNRCRPPETHIPQRASFFCWSTPGCTLTSHLQHVISFSSRRG